MCLLEQMTCSLRKEKRHFVSWHWIYCFVLSHLLLLNYIFLPCLPSLSLCSSSFFPIFIIQLLIVASRRWGKLIYARLFNIFHLHSLPIILCWLSSIIEHVVWVHSIVLRKLIKFINVDSFYAITKTTTVRWRCRYNNKFYWRLSGKFNVHDHGYQETHKEL